MDLFYLLISNFISIPILGFAFGIFVSKFKVDWFFNQNIKIALTLFLLFCIGLKGGGSLVEHFSLRSFFILSLLALWGLIQPFISYVILRRFIKVDSNTAAAISACFGSISVMNFIAGGSFLEKLGIDYDGLAITALAIMEIPAIISGVFIAKIFSNDESISIKKGIFEAILNKTILILFLGLIFGMAFSLFNLEEIPRKILFLFTPTLALFLFYMGWIVGKHRKDFQDFSWPLVLFGFYMPLVGALFGILLSYFLGLDVGSGTMIAILTASASYIAAPAAMKIALPKAKEAIYIPLSLGIAFPFNVVIGIPLYYQISLMLLS